MNRTAHIVISTIMWCGIALYLGMAGCFARKHRGTITVKALRIEIVDTATLKVVSHSKAALWLREGGIDPVGQLAIETDTRAIENYLARRPEVKRATAWTNLDGVLTVRIEQRVPAFRVRTAGGYRFWFTHDGVIIRDAGDFAAHTPVVTGAIPFPFGPTAQGSYRAMALGQWDNYLGQFRDLETERQSVTAELGVVRTEARKMRASRPKRFWSSARRKDFATQKEARLADLASRTEALEKQLAALGTQWDALKEKEKKSQQSFLFLTKLANFVQFIERDDFLAAQIVQINATMGSERGGEAGLASGRWREPQLELIPRTGDHTVLLGRLDGSEGAKLDKLRTFWLGGMRHEGWRSCSRIDIRFEGQVVCTK